jgi:hypothetical protein
MISVGMQNPEHDDLSLLDECAVSEILPRLLCGSKAMLSDTRVRCLL